MSLHLDHTEPPVMPDTNPNRPPPLPPAPAPDVVPVRDPLRPEHPDPVKEPPTHEPPISARRRRGGPGQLNRAHALSSAGQSRCHATQ